MRLPALTIGLALASLFVGEVAARANGRIPEANQLVVLSSDPDYLVLRATFGILVSADRGKTWDWICETAVGYKGTFDPPMALSERRTLLAGTFDGLGISEGGCSWVRRAPLDKRFVIDEATLPGSPREVVAVTNNFRENDDAGVSLYESVVARSSDGAKTWSLTKNPIDPTLVVQTIDFAPSDPSRLYVTAGRFAPLPGAFLLVSTDGGDSFVSHPIPLEADEPAAYIGAVDPTNPNRVYVRTTQIGEGSVGAVGGRLLVTDDAGKTFVERWRGGPPLGFALSPDGKKVWIGSGFGGLFAADTTSFAFAQRQPFLVRCLTATADRLYACATKFSAGFDLGESTDDGITFRKVWELSQIRGPLACASGTDTAKCNAEWPQLQANLGIDAGTTPPVTPPPTSSGCGCTVTKAEGVTAGSCASLAFALALALRRRRRP